LFRLEVLWKGGGMGDGGIEHIRTKTGQTDVRTGIASIAGHNERGHNSKSPGRIIGHPTIKH
jgi:hypothetical protein